MDTLITSLGPAFAVGFALQQLMEFVKPMIKNVEEQQKKLVIGGVSLLIGLGLSFGLGMRVLLTMGFTTFWVLDCMITGLIISAGTEGFNSIMKLMGYAKKTQKVISTVKSGQ